MKTRQFYSATSKFYPFTEFCKDLLEELGETIFQNVKPEQQGELFVLHIPEGVNYRVRETIKYKCQVQHLQWKDQPILN
jgi:hypothetical protein